MDTRKIGRFIAKRRKELGMTQQALADKLAITNKAVSKWETGQGVPDISLLKSLAAVLDISVDELLDGEEDEVVYQEHDYVDNLVVTKNDYFQYLREKHYHQKMMRGIFFLWAILLCGSGIACLEAYRYVHNLLNIIGMILLLGGVIMLIVITFSKYVLKAIFHEKKISYTLNREGIFYQEMGQETMFYYSQLSLMYVLEHVVVFKINKQLLWIDKKYLELLKSQAPQCCDQTSTSYQRKQWVSLVGLSMVVMLCACLLLGYHVVLKRVGFEMIFNEMNTVIWLLLIIGVVYSFIILNMRIDMIRVLTMVVVAIVIIVSGWVISQILSTQQTIYSLSPDFSHQLVLKKDKDNGKLTYYHYTFLCFAKSSNQMDSDRFQKISTKWVTNDCNVISYTNNKQKDVFVATYGDRGDGLSYYNTVGSMSGNWIRKNDNDLNYKMKVNDQGITITHDTHIDTFTYANIKQNGTIAVTLYDTYRHPKYVIAMNENCTLNQDYLLKNDGTIQLIDLDKQTSIELFCTTYKVDQDTQKQIDDQMLESAQTLIKKMQNILKEDQTLTKYQSTYDLFKIKTTSTDFFEVVRLAYQSDIGDELAIANYKCTDQITKITITAGTINDFYVEVKADTTMEEKTTGKTSKNGYVPQYRIMKGDGCYLVGRITYRVPGNVGLSPLIEVMEKDVSKDKKFCFTRES